MRIENLAGVEHPTPTKNCIFSNLPGIWLKTEPNLIEKEYLSDKIEVN